MSIQITILAKTLLENHNAIALAYMNGYDAIKYNYKVPITDAAFETHKNKWHYVELARHYHEARAGLATPDKIYQHDHISFCYFMYGEGYRKPDLFATDWTLDIRSGSSLSQIYSGWKKEELCRFDLLHTSLNHLRAQYHIQTLDNFKEMITVANGVEPPMWHAIGYSPERRVSGYSLSLQSFFLFDSYLHLLDQWDKLLAGEPDWDAKAARLKTYRKFYTAGFPINSMKVRKVINETMKFP